MPRYLLWKPAAQCHGDGYELWIQDTATQERITPLLENTPENLAWLQALMTRLEAGTYESRFNTLRHIETVRNYLNACIRELCHRQEQHDQSKLTSPEVEAFDVLTGKLRASTYGSEDYQQVLTDFAPAIQHHYQQNRHHPEHFPTGMTGMTLLDLTEMLCDWKAATLRHENGDIYTSLQINQKRFGYGEELYTIFHNTVQWLEQQPVYHQAQES